jgi:DNA sulfur modification protein DndE
MGRGFLRRLGIATLTTTLATAVLSTVAVDTASADQASYDHGYQLGLQAYRYGLPLVTMEKTYLNQTSVDVPDGHGFGPVNHFNPVRNFITPEDRSVVAPNLDTMYSIAWLDLSKQPQVIHIPKIKNRYFVLPLMSPYTEDFTNLGSVNKTPPGDYAVVGPEDAHVKLPKHVTRIVSPYDRVWIIERIYADNDSTKDQQQVNKLQDRTTVVPLNRYWLRGLWHAPRPARPDTTVDNPALPTGMAFYDQLSSLLAQFPPPAADKPMLEQLATIGVGPGLHPSTDPSLDADTVAGMKDAIAAGPATVLGDAQTLYGQNFARDNGYLVTPTGSYGTNYTLRAIVTQVGLGALRPEESIYPLALLDRTGKPLTGAKKYVVHVPADGLPPVTPPTGFWSLTLYDNDGFLVGNPINRYTINDRTDLNRDADGSFDIYIQADKPTDPLQAQNWLPTPTGGFRMIWRTYGTDPAAIPGILAGTGWKAPAVLPVS